MLKKRRLLAVFLLLSLLMSVASTGCRNNYSDDGYQDCQDYIEESNQNEEPYQNEEPEQILRICATSICPAIR